jgi:dTDP-4-dehydrorhamnose reductase
MIDCLVTGAGGALGSVLMRVLSEEHKTAYGLVSPHGATPLVGKTLRVDLGDPRSYRDRILALDPRAIIHLGAISQVAEALRDPEQTRRINVDATISLLAISASIGARFIFASTDLVFDGESAPYSENSTTEPCSYYGRTKLEAECHVLTYRNGLIVRLPLLYGLPEAARAPTFFENMLASLRAGRPVQLFEDEFRSPLWLDDAARACSRVAGTSLTGVLHMGGPTTLSRLQLGQAVVQNLGLDPQLLIANRRAQLQAPEPRPRDVSLSSDKYTAYFGAPVGLAIEAALPLVFARGPHRALS